MIIWILEVFVEDKNCFQVGGIFKENELAINFVNKLGLQRDYYLIYPFKVIDESHNLFKIPDNLLKNESEKKKGAIIRKSLEVAVVMMKIKRTLIN
ncbi:hypothetical protein QE177_15090 (plasmid) [Arsenophonus sp. aPb]|uniref:hypothetical protein n=1 Tax=Arsenophonus sp. aPb TaxID=3041619 RepID=UPI0024697C9E|nr:hypothetical protein [Arsenophonus sp. aPb]WGL99898.1 hypothetical protein QE177_15090 [Arsenophonus sp. aPb]